MVVLSNTLCGIGVKYAICCATVNYSVHCRRFCLKIRCAVQDHEIPYLWHNLELRCTPQELKVRSPWFFLNGRCPVQNHEKTLAVVQHSITLYVTGPLSKQYVVVPSNTLLV